MLELARVRSLDWDRLIRLATVNRIRTLVYWHLTTVCADAIPSRVVHQLRQHFDFNARRSLRHVCELLRLLKLFESHGIPAIPYKGPALALDLYGNLALREAGDIDILVRAPDMARAKAIISRACVPRKILSGRREAACRKRESHEQFVKQESEVLIELHWRAFRSYLASPSTTDYLWRNLLSVHISGMTVLKLDAPALLLILCVHGAQHHWLRLQWICDVAELLRQHPNLDWQRVIADARRLRVQRMVLLGICLAKQLLDAPVPADVLNLVKEDPTIEKLYCWIEPQLLGTGGVAPSKMKIALFQLLAQDHFLDRVRYLYLYATLLSANDWARLRLPDALFPIYYVLRPLRLIRVFLDGTIMRPIRYPMQDGKPNGGDTVATSRVRQRKGRTQ